MKKIEITNASAPLSEYAEKAKKGPIVVMKKGKPIAAVVPVPNSDTETVSLSASKKFLAIIERSRSRYEKEGGISSAEIRRRLRLK